MVAPGTHIMSDGWKAYGGISALPERHEHSVVNHSENFVDPVDGTCTNGVEAYWSRCKCLFKTMSGTQEPSFRLTSTNSSGGRETEAPTVILSPLLLPLFCGFSRLFAGRLSLVALAGNRFSLGRPFLACLQRNRRFSSQRTQTLEIRNVDFRLLRYRFSISWDGT